MLYTKLQDNKTDVSNYKSVMAEHQHKETSGKYSFIPTTAVLEVLKERGWEPVNVRESRVKVEENKGFQKHVVRLRNPGVLINTGKDNLLAEIILTNSHNGLSSFQLMAGIFRQVCANGLCVEDSCVATQRIKHIGYTRDAVLNAIENITQAVPSVTNRIRQYQDIILTPPEQEAYAQAALDVYYPEETWQTEGKRDYQVADKRNTALGALSPRRQSDVEPTLWNVYNRLQERMMKGNIWLRGKTPQDGRYAPTHGYAIGNKARAVKSIDRDIKLNKALWALTEHMAQLKG